MDERIYAHYLEHGESHGRRANVKEAIAQRIHDYSIDEALADFLAIDETGQPQLKVVGVMGGFARKRGTFYYRKAAELGRLLTRRGFFVVTGGGPGIMEAANLGAYLAHHPDEALPWAIDVLSEAADPGEPDPPGPTKLRWSGNCGAPISRRLMKLTPSHPAQLGSESADISLITGFVLERTQALQAARAVAASCRSLSLQRARAKQSPSRPA